MASERDRKRIDENTSVWQQLKNSFTPGYQGEAAQLTNENAALSNQNAMQEALKRRRMQGK